MNTEGADTFSTVIKDAAVIVHVFVHLLVILLMSVSAWIF